MHVTTAGEDVVADTLDDEWQAVAADVRMCVDEDVGRGAEVTEGTEDGLDGAAFVGAGVELAVGKSTGAAFTEGIVGIGIDVTLPSNEGKVALAVMHIPAALNEDWAYTGFDEAECGEKTGGAGADDDGLRGRREVAEGRRCKRQVDRALAKEETEGEFDIDDRTAGIYRATEDAERREVVRIAPRSFEGCEAQGLRVGGVLREKPEPDVPYQVLPDEELGDGATGTADVYTGTGGRGVSEGDAGDGVVKDRGLEGLEGIEGEGRVGRPSHGDEASEGDSALCPVGGEGDEGIPFAVRGEVPVAVDVDDGRLGGSPAEVSEGVNLSVEEGEDAEGYGGVALSFTAGMEEGGILS
jgi:hypothetical protein